MLLERTFQIGGTLFGITGILFLLAAAWTGIGVAFVGLLETGGIFCGFGLFFWFVGRDARRARRELLELAISPPRR